MKDESGVQIMKEFVGLRAKHVTIWKTTTMKIKKPQVCVSWKENWNLKIINQTINHLGKNKIDVKQILKTQQRFESENEWQYLDDIYKNIEECNPNKK